MHDRFLATLGFALCALGSVVGVAAALLGSAIGILALVLIVGGVAVICGITFRGYDE